MVSLLRLGLPQIEVTFDIDTDGILQVAAKDLGTSKEQSIRISGSTKLSDDEIDKMKHEAEAHKDEDEKRKQSIELRNAGDSMVHTAQKTMDDLKEKITDDEKTRIEDGKKELQESLSKDDMDDIKEKTEALQKILSDIGARIYTEEAQKAQAAQQAQQGSNGQQPNESWEGHPNDDSTIDADYEVNDDGK
jgi:molecular chaperone DnaK